jgi:hypothetical protein
MELLEVIEDLKAEEASPKALFGGEGNKVRGRATDKKALVEAAEFVQQVQDGTRPLRHLEEAMTTSDFPILFGDILDRQLLGSYVATPSIWTSFAKRGSVRDFRSKKLIAMDGAEGILDEVKEREGYPEDDLVASKDEYSVKKFGRRLDLSWETLINDDLDAFRDLPTRLGRAAKRSEDKFATSLYVDAAGPHASLYTVGYANKVTGNPALSIAGLQTAFLTLTNQRDADGMPIFIDAVTLVVPPALMVTAENILNAIQIEMTDQGGSASQKLIAQNWMKSKVNLVVDPWIPFIATSNQNTSWFLFANPNTGRNALEVGFLRGNEEPALYERLPNARRVGGSGTAMESFEDDSRAWRVRHVFGGARLTSTGGAKATVASNGSGS